MVSNSDITKSRIRNFGRMSERRVSFEIPVVHDTPVAVLRALPDAVGAVIGASPRARFVRCNLLTLTETALRYEVVYFVRAPELSVYAEVQHGIMIALMAKFRELGVQFPTLATDPPRCRPRHHCLRPCLLSLWGGGQACRPCAYQETPTVGGRADLQVMVGIVDLSRPGTRLPIFKDT